MPTPSTDTARRPRRDHRTPLLTAPPDPSQSHRPVSPPSPGRSSPAAPSSRAPSPRPRLRPRLRSPSASSHRRRTSPCRTPTSPSATSTRAKWCVIPPSRAFFTTQTVPRAGASGGNAIAGRAAGRLRAGTACFVSWSTPAQTLRPQVCFVSEAFPIQTTSRGRPGGAPEDATSRRYRRDTPDEPLDRARRHPARHPVTHRASAPDGDKSTPRQPPPVSDKKQFGISLSSAETS